MFRVTPLVRNLIIINFAVFLLQNLGDKYRVTDYLMLWPLNSPSFRPYQIFSYMFAHGSIWHIIFNMMALASFAPTLESFWGDRKFLIFYIVAGIGAGLIYGAVGYFLGGGGPMLGASGAIYGVLMAFGLLFPNTELMMMFIPVPIKAKYLVFIVGFVAYALDRSGTVAHVAHFGGALVGYIVVTIWQSGGRRY